MDVTKPGAGRQAILHAALRAPTAGTMVLYSVIDVEDPAVKARLATLCDDQPSIATAPWVLLFAADWQKWTDIIESGEEVADLLELPPHTFPAAMVCCGRPRKRRAPTSRYGQNLVRRDHYPRMTEAGIAEVSGGSTAGRAAGGEPRPSLDDECAPRSRRQRRHRSRDDAGDRSAPRSWWCRAHHSPAHYRAAPARSGGTG